MGGVNKEQIKAYEVMTPEQQKIQQLTERLDVHKKTILEFSDEITKLKNENLAISTQLELLKIENVDIKNRLDKLEKANPKPEIKEKIIITNADSFEEALTNGDVEGAINFLRGKKEAIENGIELNEEHNLRWLDHRSRTLLGKLCDADRLDEAEEFIDYAQKEEGRQGRREKIAKLRAKKTQ